MNRAKHATTALVAPPPALHACVRAFYWRNLTAEPQNGGTDGRTYIPAGPYSAVVWLIEGRVRLVEAGGLPVCEELPRILFAGPHRYPFRSEAISAYRSFGLVFQPTAAPLLTARPAHPLLDRIVPAPDALPFDWWPWLEAMAQARDDEQRVELACTFLGPRWAAVAPTRSAWVRLVEAAWQRPLQRVTIAGQNWSQRHFQRQARELTGLRAGEVERLLRCERALIDLRDNGGSLAAVAASHGYADQAHFTRDVKAFFGQPPATMLRRLGEPPSAGDWLLRERERMGDVGGPAS
ncbi:MAG: AraC family transcriptional regulator [Burkholderiaceae bacterium]|jgi:AraC-like DNA-binding protein|nr:helix-turn-helix domain-containing protein [Aquabacterium sp.]NUP85837.1 AraC family transcriptional regulator [Burkholderiaceae bacterium]